MALDYEKRSEIRRQASTTKDPLRWFAPKWTFGEREGLAWKNLRNTYSSGRTIAEKMIAYRQDLDASDDFTDEGKTRRLAEHYETQIKPKFDDLRSKFLSDVRAEARAAVAAAQDEALQLPEHPFRVAAAMRALDRVYVGVKANGGSKKLRLPDLEALDAETQRAIVATPRIVSGLNEHDYAVIQKRVLEQEGGTKLAQAREFLAAVETAEAGLDFGEALAEIEAGIDNPSPEVQRAREVREELGSRCTAPGAKDGRRNILVTAVET